MKLKWLMLQVVSLFSANLWAVDVSRCPKVILFQSKIDRVVKTSIYSDRAGWKEAQKTLQGIEGVDVRFILSKQAKEVCQYKDYDGNIARLSTAAIQDPEERDPVLVDQLVVYLNIDDSKYVSFIPVKDYSLDGVEAYETPFRVKIKARLKNPGKKYLGTYDMGMISVELK